VQDSGRIAPEDATSPYSYTVDFGDGTGQVLASSDVGPLTLYHTYTLTGTFSIDVTVYNCAVTEIASDTLTLDVVVLAGDRHVYLPIVVRP
jgi:hypothetical protein